MLSKNASLNLRAAARAASVWLASTISLKVSRIATISSGDAECKVYAMPSNSPHGIIRVDGVVVRKLKESSCSINALASVFMVPRCIRWVQ